MSGGRGLVLGQVSGQLALIAVVPILTRLVDIDEMAVYQVAFSVALIVLPVATLRLELVLPTSSGTTFHRQRRSALMLSASLCSAGAVAGALVIRFGDSTVGEIFVSASLLTMSFSLVAIENAVLLRAGVLGRLAIRNMVSGFFAAIVQVVVALVLPTGIALALAMLLGRFAATALTLVRVRHIDDTSARPTRSLTVRGVASSVLAGAISNASSQAVVIAGYVALGSGPGAQIGLAQRVAGAPTTLLGQAFAQLSLAEAAPAIRDGWPRLAPMLTRQLRRFGMVATGAAFALMLLAPPLAAPLLGEAWAGTGVYVAIFAIPLCLQLVAIPASNLLIPLGHESRLLWIQLVRLAGVLLTLVIVAQFTSDPYVVAAATSVVWSITYAWLIVASMAAARSHDRAMGSC